MSVFAVTVRTLVPLGRHEETSGLTYPRTSFFGETVGDGNGLGSLADGNGLAEMTLDTSAG